MTDLVTARPAQDEEVGFERFPFPPRGARRRDLTATVTEFYSDEADALDERRHEEWLEFLAPGFIYQVPVPLLREDPKLPRHSEQAMVFEATKDTLALKFGRVGKHYAWSDRPGANIRHLVSGVKVYETEQPGDYRVDSNVVAFWSRGVDESAMITAGRQDVLRGRGMDRFTILRRRVLIDTEVATYQQLSIIL